MRRVLIAALLLAAGAADAQGIDAERRALAEARRDADRAAVRAEGFERDASRAGDAATRARRDAAAVAARIQAAEAEIVAAEARIRLIDDLRRRERRRLARVQAPIVRLAAALQTLARRPPALALVQPGSIDDVVHVRALLSTGLPAVRIRSAGVRAALARAEALRLQAMQASAALVAGRDRLAGQRLALARMEAAQRLRQGRLVDSAMFEQDRAAALGEQARDIVDLMARLDEQAELRDRLMRLPGPIPRPLVPGLAPPPAITADATVDRRPPYRLPVVGRVTTGLGEVSESGIRARGVTIATAPAAQVVAPTSGRIAFAGPFRGYGRIVIVDHGGGWTTLIAGLGMTSVATGDPVERGSPVGTAPATSRAAITVELRRGGRPVDITRLIGGG